MIKVNENYSKLNDSYLFFKIAEKVNNYQKNHPEKDIIKLGIGDVTRALPKVCIEAFHRGVDDMAEDSTFHGYGPSSGYDFLREKIALEDFKKRGIEISADEIFVSDGSKCDTGNTQELFADDISIAIPDPVYPVYLDTNVMAGRTGDFKDGRYDGVVYMDCTKENNFMPEIPDKPVDLIYLCFPNNPAGTTITKVDLEKWVEYARDTKALILYDAAYEAFIRDDEIPRSIFEIKGAEKVAVEFRSLSKTAGFTGTRCAYTIIPKQCMVFDNTGAKISVQKLWNRRQSTKFNGVSYPVQRAAEAVFSDEGKAQTKELISYYLGNAAIIRNALESLGFECAGGEHSPYIWVDGKGKESWDFFDMLLDKAQVVCTPGAGFGRCGEGYIRISAFNSREKVEQAISRIKEALK